MDPTPGGRGDRDRDPGACSRLPQPPLVWVGSWRSGRVVSDCQPTGVECGRTVEYPAARRGEASATTASDVLPSTSAAMRTFVDFANVVIGGHPCVCVRRG